MIITIIGLGLIGGSAAIDLKKRDFTEKIIGVDNHNLHAQTALHIGLIDELMPLEKAVKSGELIILAVPSDAAIQLLPKILDISDLFFNLMFFLA